MSGHIILSHGFESGPEATKVSALGRVAEALGWSTERPDFRDCDRLGYADAVPARVSRLAERIKAASAPPVLVGSSMGAFTSGRVSLEAPCAALFLMALPIDMQDVAQPFDMVRGVPAMLVHGFADDLCPADAAVAFARQRNMPTLLVADGHRLSDHVEVIADQFKVFLDKLVA